MTLLEAVAWGLVAGCAFTAAWMPWWHLLVYAHPRTLSPVTWRDYARFIAIYVPLGVLFATFIRAVSP